MTLEVDVDVGVAALIHAGGNTELVLVLIHAARTWHAAVRGHRLARRAVCVRLGKRGLGRAHAAPQLAAAVLHVLQCRVALARGAVDVGGSKTVQDTRAYEVRDVAAAVVEREREYMCLLLDDRVVLDALSVTSTVAWSGEEVTPVGDAALVVVIVAVVVVAVVVRVRGSHCSKSQQADK